MIYALVCNCNCGVSISAATLERPGEPSEEETPALIAQFVRDIKADVDAGKLTPRCPFCRGDFGGWNVGITRTTFRTLDEAHAVMRAESAIGTQQARAAIADEAMTGKPQ